MIQATGKVFLDQADFMRDGGQVVGYDVDQARLYATLVNEEYQELVEAIDSNNMVDIIKEAMDLIVVVAGLVNSTGVNGEAAWDIVWRANMAKVSGVVEKREDGKILKNDEYKKAVKAKQQKELEALIYDK